MQQPARETVHIVMPAYNEEENICLVVDSWHSIVDRLQIMGIEASLVIANDGSKDATGARMKELAEQYPYFIPLDKPNSGHGATLLYLYRSAIKAGATYIFQTDSDGQTEPEEFWQMWESRHLYDLQIGNRVSREDGACRIMVTKILKWVVRLTFGVNVIDANTPFRLMKSSAIAPILQKMPNDFFLSNVAIAAIAVKKGLQCRWLPISFHARQGGINSINLRKISKIGIKAVGDFMCLNKSISR